MRGMPQDDNYGGQYAPINTRNQVFRISEFNSQNPNNGGLTSPYSERIYAHIAKVSITIFIGAICLQPIFQFAEPKLKSFQFSLEKREVKSPFIGEKPNNSRLKEILPSISNLADPKTLPTVKSTTQAIQSYWQIVESIRSEGTLSKEQIKEQGYDIDPKTPFKSKSSLANTRYKESLNTVDDLDGAVQSIEADTSIQITQIKHPYKKGLFIKGETKKYPHNKIEKFYFAMDTVSKENLLKTAHSLSEATSLTQTKRLLGTPSKDTFVTNPSETGELQRALVYSIQQFKPGIHTPEKDEHLIITFNEDNMVNEVYTSYAKNGRG
jgi:hypothetical protein